MNTETATDYWKRCYEALGQAAAEADRVAIWCYNNPPRRAIPKASGEPTEAVEQPKHEQPCK